MKGLVKALKHFRGRHEETCSYLPLYNFPLTNVCMVLFYSYSNYRSCKHKSLPVCHADIYTYLLSNTAPKGATCRNPTLLLPAAEHCLHVYKYIYLLPNTALKDSACKAASSQKPMLTALAYIEIEVGFSAPLEARSAEICIAHPQGTSRRF